MDSKEFKEQYQLTDKQKINLEESKKYLADKLTTYSDIYTRSHSEDVKEYMGYLAAAIFLQFKKYYPNFSIYEPFRAKSDMSFLRNIKKEINNQLLQSDAFELEDDKITADINAITIVLDHINQTIPVNPKYDYRNDEEINNLMKQSNELSRFVDEIEPCLNGLLTKKEFLECKEEILSKIIEVNFTTFTNERTPSYSTELAEVTESLKSLYDEDSYATPEEITSLNNLLKELRLKLYDKAYHTLLPQAFENVMNDSIFSKQLHVQFEFVKDSQKPNGFAANYYVLRTPFGNIEVQLQSSKRYYESRKGTAAHNSIPGKILDIKDLFELVDPNDEKPLSYYLNYLDRTPSTNILYYPSEINKNSPKYIESERIKSFLKHIKLKDTYVYQDPYVESLRTETSIDEEIYQRAIRNSPYMGICRSAHTNFRNADVIHRSRISAYSDILRKIDTLSCLGDIVIARLQDYINNLGKEISATDTDKATEIGIQAIYKYTSTKLNNIIANQETTSKSSDEHIH